MERCIFDRKGHPCEVMDVSKDEKDFYCFTCKARCTNEHDLVERYAPIIKGLYGKPKWSYVAELSKYAGRRVKLMELCVSSECIHDIIRENNHTMDTLSNITDIPKKYLEGICKGRSTSKLTAMFICQELNYPLNYLFKSTPMS